MKDTPTIYSHSGDLGDVIWSLPAIRAAGGGVLNLFPASMIWPDHTRVSMTQERAESIKSLIEHQTYIDKVTWTPNPIGIVVSKFRDRIDTDNVNIAECHCNAMDQPVEATHSAWLQVEPEDSGYPILFNRTLRYDNPKYDWNLLYRKYGAKSAFVGHPDEHEAFEKMVGKIPYIHTADLYRLARLIAACRLFVCNQSCPHAIAEGLKKQIVLIADPVQQVCIFKRPEVTTFQNEPIELPDV